MVIEELHKLTLENLAPCYVFLGDNEYDTDLLIKILKAKLDKINAADFDFFVASTDSTPLDDVISNARSFPFLAPRKMVLYKGISNLEDSHKKMLQEYLKTPTTSTCLALFVTNERYKSLAIFKKNNVPIYSLKEQKRDQVWLKKVLTKRKKKIAPEAMALLMRSLPEDKMASLNEIEKLVTYVGTQETIERMDIEENFKVVQEHNIFQLLDDISLGRLTEAMRRVDIMFKEGLSAQEFLGVVYWHFKRLWQARVLCDQGEPLNAALAKVGVKGWTRDKFTMQLKKYSENDINQIFTWLKEMDFNTRGQNIPPRTYIEKFIAQASLQLKS